MIVTLVVYGFEQYNVPSNFQPILVPQFLIMEDDDTPKFGVGFRQSDDELLYFQTQSSIKTKYLTNHTLEFSADVDHFITYVSFSVDVSELTNEFEWIFLVNKKEIIFFSQKLRVPHS